MGDCGNTEEPSLEERCRDFRIQIKDIGDNVKWLMGDHLFVGSQLHPNQHSEMKANIMLAYRHLEDARMRIGKVLQAAGDGVSILDK